MSVKVAVIGAGRWGKNLVKTFHELHALGAVVDSNPDHLAPFSDGSLDAPLLDNVDDVLQGPIPAVAIATPVATHFDMAKKALMAGKDVFVEKPLSLTRIEAEELAVLAREREKILMVGHLLLYQPAIEWIKDYLSKGTLGSIHGIHIERLGLGTVRTLENALWSLGVHDVAVLLYLLDALPEQVTVSGHQFLQEGIEDDVYLHMTFKEGVRAHLHVSWFWPEKRRRLTILGSKGMLVYDEIAQAVTLQKKRIGLELENIDEGSEVVFQGESDPLKNELKHFLDRLNDRQTPRSGPENGMRVVEVMEKATQELQQNA